MNEVVTGDKAEQVHHEDGLKTPETDPSHWVIGKLWIGFNWKLYFCDSYDPRIGFWMTNVREPSDRRNVSERAPERTYHAVRGVWSRGELREDVGYYAVDLVKVPFEVVEISLEDAKVAPISVAIFGDVWEAKAAVRQAALAHESEAAAACASGSRSRAVLDC